MRGRNHRAEFELRYGKIVDDNILNLSERDLEVFRDFFDLVKSEGLSYQRRYKYAVLLGKLFAEYKTRDFLDLDKEDLIKLAGKIRDIESIKETTAKDYLGAVKKLYKLLSTLPKYEQIMDPLYMWLYDKRNRFYSTNIDKRKFKTKKELFSEEEVMSIIEKAKTLRDKLVFSLLATQGLRPGELLSIRKQDITKKDDEIIIEVSGKTGVRPIYVEESYVLNYLDEYLKLLKEDAEFLFSITDRRLNDVLKEICYDLGIRKKAILYQFRHFAITRDRVRGLSSGAMEQKYGWSKGSKRVATYDKSVGSDYRKEIRKIAGKEVGDVAPTRFEVAMTSKTQMQTDIEYLKQKIHKYEAVFEYLDKKGVIEY